MDPSWMFLFTEKYHYSLWSQDKTLLGRYTLWLVWGTGAPVSAGVTNHPALLWPRSLRVTVLTWCLIHLSCLLASGGKRGSWSSFCFTRIPKPIILISFSPAPQICHFDGQRCPGTLHLSQWCPPACILSFGFLCWTHPAWLPLLRDSLWLLIQQGIIFFFLELLWIYLKICFILPVLFEVGDRSSVHRWQSDILDLVAPENLSVVLILKADLAQHGILESQSFSLKTL